MLAFVIALLSLSVLIYSLLHVKDKSADQQM